MKTDAAGTSWDEVVTILDALDAVGCRYWIDGGWGVDVLGGTVSRGHRDLDLDFDAAYEVPALAALDHVGYVVETDWRPSRVELVRAGRGRVDMHPLHLDPDGGGRQPAVEGGHHYFPARYFTRRTFMGRSVPCLSLEAQREFHTGYEMRPVDAHDLAVLGALADRD